MKSNNQVYSYFERKRIRQAEMRRLRREELFEKSRNMIEQVSSISLRQKDIECNLESDSSFNVLQLEDNFIFKEAKDQITHKTQDKVSKDFEAIMQKNCEDQISKLSVKGGKKNKDIYYYEFARLVQTPSWMLTVPENICLYYTAARPQGKTYLMHFTKGQVHCYDKFGRKVEDTKIFNQCEQKIKKLFCVLEQTLLEVIFSDGIFYIIDIICWKKQILSGEQFQFRQHWILANSSQLTKIEVQNKVRFVVLQYFLLDSKENLEKVYTQSFGYEKEGLLFVHKQSIYVHGVNQNVLVWKDSLTSKYPIDEAYFNQPQANKNGEKQDYTYGTARVTRKGDIYSLDGYKLGSIKVSMGNSTGYVKYRLTGIKFHSYFTHEEIVTSANKSLRSSVELENFELIKYKRSGKAEPLSRILFQIRLKNDPLKIEEIHKRIK